MKVSWYWVLVLVVAAYYYGKQKETNQIAAAGGYGGGPGAFGPNGKPSTVAKLVTALTPAKAIAEAIEPTSPAAGQTNPPGSSAWMP